MKKALLLLATLLAACAAPAQVYYYHNTAAPWDGDQLFSLHLGTLLQPAIAVPQAVQSRPGIPLALSLRYDGEKALGSKWVLGFQTEVDYTRSLSSYTFDGDCPPSFVSQSSAGQWLHYSALQWNLRIHGRFLAGYYLTETLQLHAAVGVYETLLSSSSTAAYTTDKHSGADSPATTAGGKPTMGFNIGLSTAVGVSYYFTDNLFALASAKALFPFHWGLINETRTNIFGIMLGFGYKIIR